MAQEGALFPHLTSPRTSRSAFRVASDRTAPGPMRRSISSGSDSELRRETAAGALRRRAAPRRPRARARAEAADRSARRAVLRAGRALRAETREAVVERAGRRGRDRGARHPRPGRGALDGPRGRRAPVGPARADGDRRDPLPAPVDLDVARFVGEAVIVPGETVGKEVVCACSESPHPRRSGRR